MIQLEWNEIFVDRKLVVLLSDKSHYGKDWSFLYTLMFYFF